MSKNTYTVTSPIMHGRRFEIGDAITLSDDDAARLSAYVDLDSKREADPAAVPGPVTVTITAATDRAVDFQARIAELDTDLRKHQEAIATLNDEHDKAVADLQKQITDLQAENEQLKAAAKPAAKGK